MESYSGLHIFLGVGKMAVTLSMEQRTEYLTEISTGKRVIVYNGEPFVLTHPTQQDMTDGRIIYAQFYAEYRKMNPPIPTRVEARGILNKAISDAGRDPTVLERRQAVLQSAAIRMQEKLPQERISEYLQSPNGLMLAFNEFMDALTEDERQVVAELQDQTQMEEEIMSNCAEAMAEEQRDMYLLTHCVLDKHGKKVWNEYSDIMQETDINRIIFFRTQLSLFWSGTPSQYEVEFEKQLEVISELKKDGAPNS